MKLPDIYGQGATFACSGLDCETDYNNDFVGSLLADKLGMLFHLKVRRELFLELSADVRDIDYRVVTADVLIAELTEKDRKTKHDVKIVFMDQKTVLGISTTAAYPLVSAGRMAKNSQENGFVLHENEGEYTAMAVKESGGSVIFAFSFSPLSITEAKNKAEASLLLDIDLIIEKRIEFYYKLPECPVVGNIEEKTYYKAFSVLKSNIMTAEGKLSELWTTTSRRPHRNMWLWDSVFHSRGLYYFDPDTAFKSVFSVLETQYPDGFIPHMSWPYGSSEITQPPLLSWGIWKLYEKTGKKEYIKTTYEKLKKYISWNIVKRDINKNLLFEWFIESDELCRSGESGADNSPRFDNAKTMDAVDFSCFMANEAFYLEKFAKILGLTQDEQYWKQLYDSIKDRVNTELWDSEDTFYYDKIIGEGFNKIKTTVGFFPMFAGIAEDYQAACLVKHLTDADEFWSSLPVPTVALDQPSFSYDMWRGCVWINYNYLVIEGLARYGYKEQAKQLAKKTIDAVSFIYSQTGCLFEFFDPYNRIYPMNLSRKGECTPPYDIRRKIMPIRDYGWTAAVYIALIMEYFE